MFEATQMSWFVAILSCFIKYPHSIPNYLIQIAINKIN